VGVSVNSFTINEDGKGFLVANDFFDPVLIIQLACPFAL
jgi:hypothetical protein